jgi:hypothetical protein
LPDLLDGRGARDDGVNDGVMMVMVMELVFVSKQFNQIMIDL